MLETLLLIWQSGITKKVKYMNMYMYDCRCCPISFIEAVAVLLDADSEALASKKTIIEAATKGKCIIQLKVIIH